VKVNSSNAKNPACCRSPVPRRRPTCVELPVACEMNVPINRNDTTLVYPPIQDREIASRDFCRNEYARADSMKTTTL